MTYQVLARKWRPKTFAELAGQEHVVTALSNGLTRGRVHHAYLLTGTRGVGKTTIARILAKSLNCITNGVSATPCGTCAACVDIDTGRFVDLLELDAASNTGIDNMREILDNARYAPTVGRYKVYIIDEVHQLSKSAFNALLKTLEEPPSHVKFIMATTEVHKLPATVLSRCQRYDFKRLSDEEIARQLTTIAERDGMQIAPDAIALLAREADGSMRDAQSLLEQAMAGATGPLSAAEVAQLLGVAGTELVSGVVESIIGGDAPRIVDLIGEVRRYGYDIERLLGEVMEVLRHVTVATVASANALSPSIPERHRRLATELSGKRSPLDLQRIFSSLLQTASDLRRGTHPDLVLEMGLLKVASLEPVENAAALLSKLGVIESGTSSRLAAPPRAQAPPPQAPPAQRS